jgi:hypothetical protein
MTTYCYLAFNENITIKRREVTDEKFAYWFFRPDAVGWDLCPGITDYATQSGTASRISGPQSGTAG